MPDGTLLHLRDTYPTETAWAPRYVGDELRQVRAGAWEARLAAVCAIAEAEAAQRRGQMVKLPAHDPRAAHGPPQDRLDKLCQHPAITAEMQTAL
jgi:hypothetical protein